MTADLTVDTSQLDSESRISVTGRLSIESSPRLRASLRAAIQRRTSTVIVIDVSALSYLDTSGVATLLEAVQLASVHGTRLRVLGLSGEPGMLARMTDIDRIFHAFGCEIEVE